MLNVLKNRFEQGYRTNRYPEEKVKVFPRYRGRPVIQNNISGATLEACAASCPQDAIVIEEKKIDMGRCVFCGTCEQTSNGQIKFTNDYEIATAERADLITEGNLPALAEHAKTHFKKLFGRSLQLRQVSAAGCNACEADLNVLATPFFDLARFGINFVASPRHADGIVVTGPVSKNMKTALLQTYEATPAPKVVLPWGHEPSAAGRSPEVLKSPRDWTKSCRWTCSSRDARPIP